mmetsp:Transcript_14531/g.22395  ORF Transcript_14531/g.22395 Transcript_14531/m.22395 type:complete len:130 (-) Transcript_14531:577-966(-)
MVHLDDSFSTLEASLKLHLMSQKQEYYWQGKRAQHHLYTHQKQPIPKVASLLALKNVFMSSPLLLIRTTPNEKALEACKATKVSKRSLSCILHPSQILRLDMRCSERGCMPTRSIWILTTPFATPPPQH